MKSWIFAFVAGTFLAGATPLVAEDIFRIEIGRGDRGYSDRELQRRVRQLELAVDQLQRKVFELEYRRGRENSRKELVTCYIETPFDGTFRASEATETAARAKALEKCHTKAGNVFCSDSKVKCGQ
jgi:hypothetical protein